MPLRASSQLWTLVRVVTETRAILSFKLGPYNQGPMVPSQDMVLTLLAA